MTIDQPQHSCNVDLAYDSLLILFRAIRVLPMTQNDRLQHEIGFIPSNEENSVSMSNERFLLKP